MNARVLRDWLITRLAESVALPPEQIDVRERFSHYGLDSLRAIRLIAALSSYVGRTLSPTLIWERPNIEALVAHLTEEGAASSATPERSDGAAFAQEPIAIVGMACRFPGAPDIESFWRLLHDGVDAVSEVPKDRGWEEALSAAGVEPAERDMVRRGAFLPRIDMFDPFFFGISPRETVSMDPQQRLLLELSWEALEDAGMRPGTLRGTRTGVFAGAMRSDYGSLLYRRGLGALDQYTDTGSHLSIIANRVSYILGLEGPSLTLTAACSSGLVVVHLACESLRRGESRIALASAVNLNVIAESALAISRLGALSPDGRCYSFDARASGYGRGEGGGVLVLKTLSRAIADGDPIRAVIRGSAFNNSGASNGFTAPSGAAQEAVLREACRYAGLRGETLQYVEAHGTATPIGDPIEARALGAVIGAGRPKEAPLYIGSVKTNLGHLEAAAGIAGLIKAVLAIENRLLPASLHFESPNPHAPLAELGIAVTASTRPWPAPEQLLTAGVSSFGLGGANSHVIVQEWPGKVAESVSTIPAPMFPLRGSTASAPGVVFVFPGQGAQWHGMVLTVLHGEPAFRAVIEACDRHIRRFLGWSLLTELTAPRGASRLHDIEVSLPAIISIEIAVSAWWRSMGIEPAAVVGHSTGEIAAAHVSGALDLEDTMRIICAYGRFVGRFSGRGGMAFVGLPWEEVEEALAGFAGRVFRAIEDSAEGTIVAGKPDDLAELLPILQARGVFCRPVAINVGPHSPLVDSVRGELLAALRDIKPRAGTIPLISEVTGAAIDGRALDAGHWVRNFGDPVFFSRAIDVLIKRGHRVFLDVGPHAISRHSVETNLRRAGCGPGGADSGLVLASLRRDEDGRSTLRSALAALKTCGFGGSPVAGEPANNDALTSQAEAFLLPLSAKSPEALLAQASAYAELLKSSEAAARLRDITYTASLRREHHPYRLAVAGRSAAELHAELSAFARGDAGTRAAQGHAPLSGPQKVVFVFPGQGSQWIGMGRTLFAQEPVFRAAIEACDEAIFAEAGFSVIAELHAEPAASGLERIDVVQPLLFAMEVALAALWQSWGVRPDCVVGHSMGEVAAAHVAGILSLKDAAAVICRRSKLLRRVSGKGAMGLLELTAAEAEKVLAGYEDRLSIAACNGPRSTVISGDPAALDEILSKLEKKGVFCRRVKVDVASHSPQVDPLLGELLSVLSGVRPASGQSAMRSTVTGAMAHGPELDANYWVKNLRAPVLFADAVQKLAADGPTLFVELSPHPILLPSVEENLRAEKREGAVIASVRRESDERRAMLEALGELWAKGAVVDLAALYPAGGRVVSLPAYPWQRERFWIDTESAAAAARDHAHTGGHPLLGRGLALSTEAGTRLWETTLSAQRLPWLRDHKVQGAVAFPGAGTLEMALAAGTEAFGSSPFFVTGVSFVELLTPAKDAATAVQVVATEEQPGRLRFQVASHAPDASTSEWTVHARGTLVRGERAEPAPCLDLSALRARLGPAHPADITYASLRAMGLDYGPAFSGLVELWHGEGEVLGRVQLPAAAGSSAGYHLHPALLDACFQVVASTFRSEKVPWVPIEVGSLRLLERSSGELFCHAILAAPQALGRKDRRSAELLIVDAQGVAVAEISGLVIQRLAASDRPHAQDDWFLELTWELAKTAAPAITGGRFLLLGEGGGIGAKLRAALVADGHKVVHAVVGAPDKVPAGSWPVDDTSAAGVRTLLESAFAGQLPSAVVHLRSLEERGVLSVEMLQESFARGYDSVLHTVQALGAMSGRQAPRLWIVTRGAQTAGNLDVAVEQSPLLGLGRVIALEHPELRCARIDLDPARPADETADLLAELLADGPEHEIALRGGERRVARLVHAPPKLEDRQRVESARGRPFRLTIEQPGILDNLLLRPLERRPPGPFEVEIAVEAAGLNFVDVVTAMALPLGPREGSLALGGECAGQVVAVGEAVRSFKVGQEVLALVTTGSFGTHATVDARLVARRPAGLTTVQAATIPAVFTSAWYALFHLARLKAGERVLIHSGTGGTGLAAIQIARSLGAEVFATAGSEAKRAWLREQGIAHVMDSRSLSFADEVLAATGGQGVDVVLNSLSGAAIEASLSALAADGRFIELGKTDIYAGRPLRLSPFKKSLSYSAVDLLGLVKRRPERVATLLDEVIKQFEQGALEPLPVETFPMMRAADAFRKMARAQHIGKLALLLKDPETSVQITVDSKTKIRRDGSYLVTGGLGGLGLSVAGWLAAQGAGHLVLLGRSGAVSAEQQAAISALKEQGTRVTVAAADVADRAAMQSVLFELAASSMPLAGVVHAAGVLYDGLLSQQTPARFRQVMASKILGAFHLHTLTRDLCLDFFVMYSSAAGLLGNPGQGNYAAANTFLDALAHHRRAAGLPALSIDWGGFSEVGLAAAQDNRGARLSSRGLSSITPAEGLMALSRVLDSGHTQIGVALLDARQWVDSNPAAASSPMFNRLLAAQPAGAAQEAAESTLLKRLTGAESEVRTSLLQEVVRTEISRVLRLPESRFDMSTPLIGMGLDSLMGMELKHRLKRATTVDIPVPRLLTGMTAADLIRYLHEHVPRAADAPAQTEKEATQTTWLDTEL